VAVVRNDDWDDRDLGLDGEMESALFEWEEVRVVVVASRAFGKDKDTLSVVVHLFGGVSECGKSLFARGALNEDGF
jgi:hypothetical protein